MRSRQFTPNAIVHQATPIPSRSRILQLIPANSTVGCLKISGTVWRAIAGDASAVPEFPAWPTTSARASTVHVGTATASSSGFSRHGPTDSRRRCDKPEARAGRHPKRPKTTLSKLRIERDTNFLYLDFPYIRPGFGTVSKGFGLDYKEYVRKAIENRTIYKSILRVCDCLLVAPSGSFRFE